VDFTREPIIETVITPREGCKLAVRSSKTSSQEEYFVDAVEIVSFGTALFYRSLERPKNFLVPVSDYEVLEVREARMVLKHVGGDRSAIKIGGGREANVRQEQREAPEKAIAPEGESEEGERQEGGRADKKKDRRRPARRRKSRGEREEAGRGEATTIGEDGEIIVERPVEGEDFDLGQSPESSSNEEQEKRQPETTLSPEMLASLLMPPPVLISDTIARYKENFKEAFYTQEELDARQREEKAVIVENAVALVEAGISSEQIGAVPMESLQSSNAIDDDDLWNFTDDKDNDDQRQ
jgi:hypothetical protein